jgi:hypothetical protein
MGLPRTFVGFSSTDIHYYRLMLAWKHHEHIDFNFTDCQLHNEIRSNNEARIRSLHSPKAQAEVNLSCVQENIGLSPISIHGEN